MNAPAQRTMSVVEIADRALRPAIRPVPVPGPGEVLIRVAAAGVNRPDLLQKIGKYPPPPGASDLPGLEVAGVVEVAPPGCPFAVGDAVCALLAGGGYAEYAAVPFGHCLPVPPALSMAEAAALPEAVFTVWANLFQLGHLQAGDIALIHGGASGVGSTAIRMALAFGARVIATARGIEKQEACRDLGAEAVLDAGPTLPERLRAHTGGRGANVALDILGGAMVGVNLDALAFGGRHVSIAWLTGAEAAIPLPMVMQKRLTLTGSTLRPRSSDEKAALAQEIREQVWPKVAAGSIRPVLHARFPLSEADAAHRVLEENRQIGKVVLIVGDDPRGRT